MSDAASDLDQLSKADRIAIWFMPNLGDVIFPLVLVFLFYLRPCFLFGDGSTGWHLVAGEYILKNGVPHTDLMSYTFPDKHWVAYEWLFDALVALPVQMNQGNLNLLAVCVGCAIASLMLLLYGRMRKEGASFPLALILVLIGSIISAVHFLARPHIATFFGVYFFTTLLEDFWRGTIGGKKLVISLTVIMILWVNMHPAFLIGLVLVFINLFSAIVAAVYTRGTQQFAGYARKLKVLGVGLLGCLGATFITPYGLELQEYMLNYMKGTKTIAGATHEFFSPVFHGDLQPVCLEIFFALFIVGLAISKQKLSLPRLLTCLAFSHLALSAVRNMPLYAIVILPAIAQLYSNVSIGANNSQQSEEGLNQNLSKKWRTRWKEISKGFDKNEALCSKHFVSLLTFLVLSCIALNNGELFGKKVLNSTWSAEDKPSATLAYLKEQQESGKLDPERGFNYDNWGGFLRYTTGKRVIIDDRAEFYGEPYYAKYTVVFLNLPGAEQQLDGEIYKSTKKDGNPPPKVQWVLMPRNSAISTMLKNNPNWGPPVKEDMASELFVRKSEH